MRVLISAPYLVPYVEEYRHFFTRHNIEVIVADVEERLNEEELLNYIGDIDGILAGDDRLTDTVLSYAPRLKVLSKWGTGIDSFDLESAARNNISVYNIPGAFNDSVSDSVIGYILAFARRIPWTNEEMHAGKWKKQLGRTIAESTIGIVGVGNTGSAVIRKLKGFNTTILGNDVREIDQTFCNTHNVNMVSLKDVLEKCDFVSLNCDLNPTSHHLLGSAELQQMKPSSVVINCARGPVIDNAALAEALKQGVITGAALDVFEEEPLPGDSPLLGLPNIIMAPHNANSSPSAWRRVHLLAIRNVLRGLGITDEELETVK